MSFLIFILNTRIESTRIRIQVVNELALDGR
jgi:hypothetical protein